MQTRFLCSTSASRKSPLAGGVVLGCALIFAGARAHADGDRSPTFDTDQRIPWTTSRLTGSPDPPERYRIVRVFPQLKFENPVVLTDVPSSCRLVLAELSGKVYSFPSGGDAAQADLAIDLGKACAADRVYGLTFHPHFPSTPYCYICYTIGQDIEEGTRVSRFEVDADSLRIAGDSERTLITWVSGGHNGGCLKFGPDGYLYISTGDGGPAFPPDPREAGQDITNLLATILRIDVDHVDLNRPYAIPAGNPFVGRADARAEIWAYGFRNPWKMSFDARGGDLWVGDVGWELWEMIYRVQRGANYGWSIVEGPQPVHLERPRGPTPIVPPTAQHSHIEARSVTGGFVYRGARLPELQGQYVYGDYVTGKIWCVSHDVQGAAQPTELVDTPLQIICFGVDRDNELYIVDYEGTIHSLEANSAVQANQAFPQRLSETGLFQSVADHLVAPGVIPYSVIAAPWMDGATAERFVAVPGDQSLDLHMASNAQVGFLEGDWKYPTDSVLMKTISIETKPGDAGTRQRLETQLLHFNVDQWKAYNYIWNEDQTDAELAADVGSSKTVWIEDPSQPGGQRQQTWHFASRTECILCHTARGGSIYGFRPEQLDRDHRYGSLVADQLQTLKQLGIYDALPPRRSESMVDPYDDSEDLEQRARAYLAVNCAHCHRRGGGGTAHIELPYQLPLRRTHLLDARPTQGTFGMHRAKVIAAGDPLRSVLYYRMAKLGRGRMPYLGSSVIDQRGLQLIHDWIERLGADAEASEPTAAELARRQAIETLLDPAAGDDQDQQAIEELLSTTSGALLLVSTLDRGTLDTGAVQRSIAAGTNHNLTQVRDLFERYTPEAARIRRLGPSVDPAAILALSGDASRGRELFEKGDAIQCRSCHQVGQLGTALGPELSEIAKKQTREQLLESILQPSKDIAPQYVTQLIETADGKVQLGILESQDDEKLVLRDAQNNRISIPRGEIDFHTPQQKSLMPELLVQDMTAQELADLLAFLADL